MEQLEKEARELADQGVKELILVAQETTLYGKDLYGEKKLPELLRRLSSIPGIQWIRLQYCYPEEITDELIETIKNEETVCHYLDMPRRGRADLCEHRAFPDVRGLCTGPGHRRSGIRSDWGG